MPRYLVNLFPGQFEEAEDHNEAARKVVADLLAETTYLSVVLVSESGEGKDNGHFFGATWHVRVPARDVVTMKAVPEVRR